MFPFHLPLILDGATGTNLQKAGMPKGVCPEQWIMENSQALISLQKSFRESGSDIILAPTFGANSHRLASYGLSSRIGEINGVLTALAQKSGAMVAGDMTALGMQIVPYGSNDFDDLLDIYREQALLLENNVDLFDIETMFSLAECRAAVLAVKEVSSKPVFVTVTVDKNGKTMMGEDACAILPVMEGLGVDAFGLNCSEGPDVILPVLKKMSESSHIPLIAKPNAGLPLASDEGLFYPIGPEEFAGFVPELAEAGVRIFGGCCGTEPEHIKALSRAVKSLEFDWGTHSIAADLFASTGRITMPIDKMQNFSEPIVCNEDLEDELSDASDEKYDAVRIVFENEEDVDAFLSCSYALTRPLMPVSANGGKMDPVLLDTVLRKYQGRAVSECVEDVKAGEKYGLLLIKKG